MVEEKFKIGVELEVTQDSLEDITRQVKRKLAEAFRQGPRGAAGTIAGGPATIRSAREAVKVDASDLSKEIRKALATEATSFTKASQEVVKAVEKLSRILEKKEPAGGAAEKPATAEVKNTKDLEKAQSELIKATEHEAAAREKAAQAAEKAARATITLGGIGVSGGGKARQLVAEQQQGPTNVRIGANIDTRRAAGSQRTAGGGAGTKASLLGDAPREKSGKQVSEERKTSGRPEAFKAGAEQVLHQVSQSIAELRNAILKSAGGKVDERFFERIGLAGAAKIGPGASPAVERLGREAEHIVKTIKLVDNRLESFSNVITDRVRELTSEGGAGRFERLTRTAAKDRGAFEAQARAMVSEVFEGLPKVSAAQPLAGLQKGGEAKLAFKVTGEIQKRLSALETEAEVIAELNKILWEASQGVGELAEELQKLKKFGIEVMTTFGLSESVATQGGIIRGESEKFGKPGPVEQITLPVQTRNLAELGVGGIGAMRAARIFQPQQLMEVMGGGAPSVMGAGEREMYQRGLLKPGAFKEAKTALVDPSMIPELFEDQVLFDPKLLSMPMKEVRSMLVHQLSEGLVEGMSLAQDQVIGTKIGGEDIKFSKEGIEAKVSKIEKTIIDGIDAYRVQIEEVNDTITGMKLTERSGIKGIAKAVPDLAEKFGLPTGTAVAMSTSAVARRGSLRLPIEMMSNTISEATGAGAQEIADKIVAAMSKGGKEFAAAVKQVAEQYGLKGFTGAEVVKKGPIAEAMGGQAAIMTGKVALGRLPRMGMRGEMPIEERFFGATDVQGLKLMSQNEKMAQDMQANLSRLTQEFSELRLVLNSLAGSSEEAQAAVKDLAVVLPEQLKRLPQSAVAESDLKGTLLDPDLHEAIAARLPTREGEKLMRIPKVGVRTGERELFRTEIGTVGGGKVTRQLDRIMEQATKVRALQGKVPITESAEAMEEASYRANDAIQKQIAAIIEMGTETEEGAAAARTFIENFMPLVKMLGTGPTGLQYRRGGKVEDVKVSPEQYVKFQRRGVPREVEQQMLAIRDLIGKRAGTGVNVERLGAVFTNLDILNKVMQTFGITLDGTGKSAEEALSRLEKLEEELLKMLAESAISRTKPEGVGAARKRSLAQAREAGASLAPIGVAIEFPTDVSEEMAAVGARLRQMRDAGASVDEALSAFGRMETIQKAQKGIPKDVVLINEEDWNNLVQAVSKKYKIPMEEAAGRLQRTGLLHRYPTTGPRSFLPTELRKVGPEVLPKGALGVGGPAAISSAADLEKILKPLMQLKTEKIQRLEELGGVGDESKQIAQEIRNLNREINGLIPVFRAIGLNLDFDGDKIAWHGDVANRASSELETFSDKTKRVISLQDAWINVMGKSIGKGGMGGIQEYSDFFGKVVKGRPEGLRSAVLRPADPEMAGFEAHAHIAGKKSVGILSDMFNRMLMSVTAGSTDLGNAFETWIGSIMLGINKALAQKHGAGGVTGPGEFLSFFRKGQLDKIREGMEGGQGFLGELGQISKQMRSQIREQLLVTGAGEGGLGKLRDFFKMEGIEGIMREELQKGNLISIVDKAVEELDLFNTLVRMFDHMKQNMIKAITTKGATLDEAVAEVTDMLKPQGKAGFIKGIDQKKILESFFPGYATTRKSMAEEIKGMPAADQIRKILEMLPQQIIEQVTDSIEEVRAVTDTKDAAQVLRQALLSWFESIKQQGIKFIGAGEMKAKTGMGALGAYVKEEDQIFVQREKGLSPFAKAMVTLGKIAEGTADPLELGAEGLKKLRQALADFIGVIGHENVHKMSKKYQEFVIQPLIDSMVSPKGKGTLSLAKGAPNIGWLTDFMEKTPNVKWFAEARAKGRQAMARGEETFKVTTPKGEEKVYRASQEFIGKITSKLLNLMAEELLAYQFNPRILAERGLGEMPEKIAKMLQSRLAVLAKKEPEIIGAARDALDKVNSGYLTALIESVENINPEAVRAKAQARAGQLMEFAGRGKFVQGQEVLTQQERGIMEARQVHKLTSAERLPTGELGLGELRKMAGGGRPELKEVVREVEEIQKAIIAGVAPEELGQMQRRMRGLAGKTAAVIGRLTRTGELAGASPVIEMASLVQDFFMTVAQRMTVEARGIQRQIAAMEQAGQVDAPEFAQLLEKFDTKIKEINVWLEKASLERMGKHQQLAVGGVTTLKGEMLPGFKGLGLDVAGIRNLEAAMSAMSGGGVEGQEFTKRFGKEIMNVVAMVRQGASATEGWSRIFSIMRQHPEQMKVDANKLQAILTQVAKIVGTQEDQYGQAATNLGEMAKNARRVRDALEGLSPEDYEQTAAALAGASKQQRRAFARGVGGGDLVTSMQEQQTAAMQSMESRRKILERLAKTPEYRAMGAPKIFEPQQFEIVDPQTGQVVQKLTASFKRMGNTIKASMEQGGAATQAFGHQLRTAFRRVVQWGFASGIIYGTVRAFRSLIDVVTTVQNKVVELQKVMDTTTTNFEQMQDSAVGMAKTFGIAIEDVLEGMVVYGQQGLTMNEIMDRTRSTMLAVNTTTLSTAEATEALTSVMKVFSDELSSSEQAVDAWAAVAAKHAVTAKDLALGVQRAGAAAKTAGVDFEDFLGISTAIGSVTRQSGKEVATGVKFMMRAMRQPGSQKELLGVGIMSQDVAGELRPATDILGELAGKWDGLSRSQKLNLSQAMAGIRHYNQFIVLMENWQEALDASATATDSQGFASQKNAIAMQSFAKQMQVLRETVKSFALDIGKVMLPAMTMIVQVLQKLVGVLDYIPDPLKQIGVVGTAAMLAFHRTADLTIDTLDALFGYDFGKKAKEMGMFKAISMKAGGMAKGGMRMMSGIKTAMTIPLTAKATEAGDMTRFAESAGLVASGFLRARIAVTDFIKGLTLMKAALLGTGVGLFLAALGALAVAYSRTSKSGKDVEDELFDLIGRSQEATRQLQSQGKQLDKLSHLWGKYESAVKTAADPSKLQESIGAGTFKSPLKALKEYKDSVSQLGLSFAQLDPSMIEGISESGDYLFTASDGMRALSMSAADAQKTTTGALQIKVIKAYADEISKAKGVWANFIEVITLGTKKMDLMAQIGEARENINALAEEMKKLSERGIMPTDLQGEMNAAVSKELELRGEIVASAENLRRVLAQLPRFEDTETARALISTPEMKSALATGAASGIFGKEATAGSLQMQYMSRQVGLGGLIGGETTANPQRFMEDLLERGMKLRAGGLTEAGQVGFLDPQAAKTLIEIASGTERLAAAKDPASVIERARTVITGVDQLTGEIIYYFEDGIDGAMKAVRASELGPEIQMAMQNMLVLDRNQVEQAAEKTRKLLTLQATGALAGIRIPEGGMPELGPARFRELTPEQRILGALPDEMQRLAEVQAELTQIQKSYNESIEEGADISEESARALKDNFKVLPEMMKDLAISLQMEQFDLTVLGHIQGAFVKLQQTLEEAAVASRDAAIEEETRLQLLKHTGGALAGMAVVPQIDFGKAFRELTAEERLQKEMGPGFARTLTGLSGVQGQYETGIQTTIDVRKQMADFDEMLKDLDTARGRLTEEQERGVRAKITGTSKGEQLVADAIQKQGEASLSELQRQTPILDRMLEVLKTLGEIETAGTPEEKRKAFETGIAKVEADKLFQVLGAAGGKTLETFLSTQVGLRKRAEEEISPVLPDFYERTGAKMQFKSPENKAKFEEISGRIEDLYENATAQRRSSGKVQAWTYEDLEAANKELLQVPEVAQAARDLANSLAKRETATRQEVELRESENKRQQLINQISEMRTRVLGQLSSAEQQAVSNTEQAARILQSKESFRLAIAAQNFALSLEGAIKEFEKAEMLFYEKVSSDIEGPFARVGRPGFKTEFEQRRTDLEEQGRMRPMTIEEMGQRRKDLVDVEFDEKEARIKQQQDTEVNALRQQQQQAERIRDIIAEQLMGGDLTPEMAGMSRQYLDTLTEELATSEQAQMQGEDLYFKGVPGLEDARNFLQKIQEHAKEQAQKAEKQFQQEVNQPIVDQQKITNTLLSDIRTSLKSGQQPGQGAGMVSEGTLAGVTAAQRTAVTSAAQAAGAAMVTPAQAAGVAPAPGLFAPGAGGLRLEGPGGPGAEVQLYDKFMGGLMESMRAAAPRKMELEGYRETAGGVKFYGEAGGEALQRGTSVSGPGIGPGGMEIPSLRQLTGPLTDAEKLKGVFEELQTGAGQVFMPTGKFKDATGALSFTDRPDATFGDSAGRQVGLSNYNQVLESQQALKYGNRELTTGSVLTDSATGRTPGAQNADRVATGREDLGAEAQTEAITSLSEQLTTLIESVNNLSTADRGSTEIVAAVTESSATIVDALGSTLNVNVENAPLEVSIPDLEASFASAIDSSGLGSVGSEVADTRLRLEVLEGLIDPSGPSVEDRITAATDLLNQTLVDASTSVTDLGTNVESLRTQVEALSSLEGLDVQVTSIQDSLSTIGEQVETNTADIVTLRTDVDANITAIEELRASLEEFSGTIGELTLQAADSVSRVDGFETLIEELEDRVIAAETTVEASAETVEDLRNSLIALQTTVESNKQGAETQIRERVEQISRLETRVDQQAGDIQMTRGKAETALSQAQQALNVARRPGR